MQPHIPHLSVLPSGPSGWGAPAHYWRNNWSASSWTGGPPTGYSGSPPTGHLDLRVYLDPSLHWAPGFARKNRTEERGCVFKRAGLKN